MKLLYSFLGMLLCSALLSQPNFSINQPANLLIGQTSYTSPSTVASASISRYPFHSAVSATGMLAVADEGRIMIWQSVPTTDGTPADYVLGRPNFTSTASGCTQALCSFITGVVFTPDGKKLIASDMSNNRVLIWDVTSLTNGQNADVVIGQSSFATFASGCSATSLNAPTGIATTNDGRLLIPDLSNNRVLIYNSIPEANGVAADVVVGQSSFTASTGGSGLNNMQGPWGCCVSPSGKLIVSAGIDRVMIFNSIPTTNGVSCDVTIGTTGTAGLSQSQLHYPAIPSCSPYDQLAFPDNYNNRALIYNSIPLLNSANADVVLAQPNFVSGTSTNTPNGLWAPTGANFDMYGRLYISDNANNRVLRYGSSPTLTTDISLTASASISTLCSNSAFTVTFVVTNSGSLNADSVDVSAALPYVLNFGTASASAGTYNSTGGVWHVGSLGAGASATLTLNGNAGASNLTASTLRAGVSGIRNADVNFANNAATIMFSAFTPTLSLLGNNIACSNSVQTFTLDDTGGVTDYTWTAAGNTTLTNSGAIATATIGDSGTITVVVSNSMGCLTAPLTETLVVIPTPTITISGPATSCMGSSVSFTANGADTYTWSSGPAAAVITDSPVAPTSYSVTGTATNGCTQSATFALAINPLPTVSIAGSSIACSGSATSFTASGAASYLWNSGGTTSVVSVSSNTTTTVSVTGTDANTCSQTATIELAIISLPGVAITSPTAICSGNSATLTASGADTYSWSTNSTSTVIIDSPASGTTYSVTGTDANGCSQTATLALTINSLPTVAISGPTAACVGSSVNLTASGANTYLWDTNASSTVIAVAPTLPTSYTVTGTDQNGCTGTATVTVGVNTLPLVSINGPTASCLGGSTALLASGGDTYLWSTSETTTLISVSPTLPSSYSVTGTDVNGCSNSASISLGIMPSPTIAISGPTAVCLGSSASLLVSGADTYSWSTNSTSTVISVSPAGPTTYTVTGFALTGCQGTAAAFLMINPLPAVSVSGPTASCLGSNVDLTAAGAQTYSWTTSATTSVISVSPSSPAFYTVTGTDANGCSGVASTSLYVNVDPIVSITGPTVTCLGSVVIFTAQGASTYSWSNGDSGASVTMTITAPTVITLTGADATGCTGSVTNALNVNQLPMVEASTSNSMLCAGDTATLTATGAANYTWTTNEVAPTITVNPISNTSYTVTGKDVNGCVNTATIEQQAVICTGIAQQSGEDTEITIYPNPNKGEFILNAPENTAFSIINSLGQVVGENKTAAGQTPVSISNLPNGIYFLQVHLQGHQQTMKVIKD